MSTTEHETAKPLVELLEPGSTLMVGTRDESGTLEFRPLTVARVRGGVVEILVDANEDWARAFNAGDALEVTMGDNRANVWLSMHANGELTRDEQTIDELWNPFAAAYFDNGRESEGIAVLTLNARSGRYWSSPSGRIGSLVSMIRAKISGAEDSGDHGPIQL